MKKILPFIFVAVLMIFAVAQTSEAVPSSSYPYPNSNYVEYLPASYFDGYAHAVITYDASGGAYAIVLTPDGWPASYYYQYYLSSAGYLYISTDGHNWYSY